MDRDVFSLWEDSRGIYIVFIKVKEVLFSKTHYQFKKISAQVILIDFRLISIFWTPWSKKSITLGALSGGFEKVEVLSL
nr:hypothetical protein [Zobellia laminariae]